MSFKSVHDYTRFATAVRTERRFIHSDEIQEFLQAVVETGRNRETILQVGRTLWRAQIGYREWHRQDKEGNEWVEEAPFSPERMCPPLLNPSEGRANPRGIAYLYLATNQDTAVAEVRPWSGSLVTVASFQAEKELRLVDFSRNHGRAGGWMYLYEIPPDRRSELTEEDFYKAVWADIDNAFSQPVAPNDPLVSYVPTQVIAELFRSEGYDGVVYRSALSKNGFNVTLFNVNMVVCKVCHLFSVNGVKYEYEESTNPWFVQNRDFLTNVVTEIHPLQSTNQSQEAARINPPLNDQDR